MYDGLLFDLLRPFRRVLYLALGATVSLAAPGIGHGQAPTGPENSEFERLITDAKQQFQPISDQEITAAKNALAAASRDLDQLLSRGSDENRARWHRFLGWEALRDQLDTPDPNALFELHRRFTRNANGLELERFARVRKAITRYRELVVGAKLRREDYDSILTQLAERLKSFGESRRAEDGAVIGHALGWLESHRQAPELVAAIRQRFWQPNLYAEISGAFLAAGLEDTVHETTAVNDYQQGTTIQGSATLRGNLKVRLIPDPQQARLAIALTGGADARTNGYHGRITILASGQTQVQATKLLLVDDTGVHPQPAKASCQTSSSIDGVCARSCLVQKIAYRKAQQSQGTAEYRASRQAEQQIAQRMDAQAAEMLADSKSKFDDRFRNPLLRRGEFPQQVRFSTTNDHVHLVMMQTNSRQLGAWSAPPQLPARRDIAVRVHETMISNFSEAILGGETITDERLEEMMLEMTGEVPEELKVGPDKDPWSITFPADRPISAEFRDDTVRITLHGRRFTRSGQELRHNVNITALYRIERSPELVKLVRQGDVEVNFIGRRQLSVSQVAFKTFLRKKFLAVFKESLEPEGLKLKGKWERVGQVVVDHVTAAEGWATLVWNRVPEVPANIAAQLDGSAPAEPLAAASLTGSAKP